MTPKAKIIAAIDSMTPKAERNVGSKILAGNGWSISFGMFLFNMYCSKQELFPYYNGIEIKLSPTLHICGIILEHTAQHEHDYNYSDKRVFCGHTDCLNDEELATSCLLE